MSDSEKKPFVGILEMLAQSCLVARFDNILLTEEDRELLAAMHIATIDNHTPGQKD
jgi:hypothetical protein